MSWGARTVVLAAAIALAAASTVRATAPVSPQKVVEGAIMCSCPDHCNQVLIGCKCGYSAQTREHIQQMLAQGMSPDQIIARFVAEEGKVILAAPTTQGFDLAAWILPFAALGLAVPVVLVVIRRLGSGGQPTVPGAAGQLALAATPGTSSPALSDRLERELRDLDT